MAGKWKTKSHCLADLVIKLSDFKMDLINWQVNFGSCNFGMNSYLWFQIRSRAARVRFWNHAYDFRPHCMIRSSVTFINPATILDKLCVKNLCAIKWNEKIRFKDLICFTYSPTKTRNQRCLGQIFCFKQISKISESLFSVISGFYL